ncbi:MAG TPA: CDP-glycerol--glycerophosphate glycerophosphotransferase, partial [Micromonosporaceae bacterium]|nr:CDP-glycerol--glycerophosphate glycerophosphotransferase [Micromonosporaceae bacterium]
RREGSITSSPSARHFEVFDQYARLFARVAELAEAGHPEADGYRRELFRAMVDHHLVIVGHRHRLPKAARRAFFREMVEAYRRYEPAGGYSVPTGVQGVKHRLVQRDAYRAFAALRLGYRVVPRAARRGR